MNRILRALNPTFGLCCLLMAGLCHAQTECSAPDAPSIPNGDTASEQELVNAAALFKAYQQELIAFRECLTSVEQEYGEDITVQLQRRLLGQHNESVEDEESLAAEFNDAVRAYRAANED